METAVILAAGLGTRLQNRTRELPKGMLALNGQPLVERSCRQLAAHGIRRIVIGTGHLDEVYRHFADTFEDVAVECLRSNRYETTGSMYTLYALRHVLQEPFLLLESDLLYESRALRLVIDEPAPDVMLTSGFTHSGDEVYVQIDPSGYLDALSKVAADLQHLDAELVGINKLSLPTYQLACEVMERHMTDTPRLDYEQALVEVGRHRPVRVVKEENLVWCEIDDERHLARAIRDILPRVDPVTV